MYYLVIYLLFFLKKEGGREVEGVCVGGRGGEEGGAEDERVLRGKATT